jgi:hypothetical protein
MGVAECMAGEYRTENCSRLGAVPAGAVEHGWYTKRLLDTRASACQAFREMRRLSWFSANEAAETGAVGAQFAARN